MSVSRETGLSPPLNIILTNSLCFWRGSRSTLTAAPPAPELQTSTSLLPSLLHSDCSSLREYRMRSLPLDTYGLRPHIQPPQRSLSSFRPRTSLLTSSTSNNRFSSASAATFHRNASLQISNERISVWNRNPLLCSKTERIDVGLLVPPLRCGSSSDTNGVQSERTLMQWIELIGEALSTAFPVWVALGCLLGLLRPASYDWVQPRWTVLGLTVTMLGMGMTLTLDDLRGALAMPKELISGFLLQYSVMPISGYVVSKLLNLPSYYAAGLILVGCCPGGTASNIVTYIARGNVALSVLMTAMSTVAAVIMTPFLTAKLAGQFVAVDAAGLLRSTLQIVLLPVLAGAFLNQYFHGLVRFVSPLMPPIAVGTVAVLCGNAIAQSSSAILTSGMQVLLAASLLHMSGFFFGYVLARMLGIDTSSSRTISIEVGMQNSVLGVVLATQHFGNPLTAVPCAVSSVCHSIFGSVLAGIWRQSKD